MREVRKILYVSWYRRMFSITDYQFSDTVTYCLLFIMDDDNEIVNHDIKIEEIDKNADPIMC